MMLNKDLRTRLTILKREYDAGLVPGIICFFQDDKVVKEARSKPSVVSPTLITTKKTEKLVSNIPTLSGITYIR